MALQHVCKMIGRKSVTSFATEKNVAVAKITNYVANPKRFDSDILKRDSSSLPAALDVYTWSSPCQKFSIAGNLQGIEDDDGQLYFAALEAIQQSRPKLVISENVTALQQRYYACREVLDAALHKLGYETRWKILNTADYDVPHQRKRLYLIAIRSDVLRSQNVQYRVGWWPEPRELEASDYQRIHNFVDVLPPKDWATLPQHKDWKVLYKNNVKSAYKHCFHEKGINPFATPVLVDMGATPHYSYYRVGVCPCLTRTRCSTFGYWCSTKGGPLSLEDMMRLQGFAPEDLPIQKIGVSASQMAGALGNACSLNVMKAILPRALYLASIIQKTEYDFLVARMHLPS